MVPWGDRFRKWGKAAALQTERGVGICERSNSADTEISGEGGAGGALGTGGEIALQPLVQTMGSLYPPAAQGGP